MKAGDYVSYLDIIIYDTASVLYSVIKQIYKYKRKTW